MAGLVDVEASCAICGAQPYPNAECLCESQRLELALNQAIARWDGISKVRDWVLHHSRNQIQSIFDDLKTARYEAHKKYLQTLPCFTLYQKFHGNPPVSPSQLQLLQQQISHAQAIYKSGVDEDWRRSCLRYPEVLDYFFALVDVELPSERESAVLRPRFGGVAGVGERRMIKARRSSRGSTDVGSGRRKKKRHHSRGRTQERR